MYVAKHQNNFLLNNVMHATYVVYPHKKKGGFINKFNNSHRRHILGPGLMFGTPALSFH